jgi:hypothetical protein
MSERPLAGRAERPIERTVTEPGLAAESSDEGVRWSVPLLTVKARYWQSHGSPRRPE